MKINSKNQKKITTIINNSFNGCIGLTYIKIPFNVNYIGENAFAGTTNLQDFKKSLSKKDFK